MLNVVYGFKMKGELNAKYEVLRPTDTFTVNS